MQDSILIYAICLLVSASLTLIAFLIAWKRSVPGSFSLSLLLLAMTIWSGFHALTWLPVPAGLKLVLPNFVFVGVVSIPTLYLSFTLSFTGHEVWHGPRFFILLAVEPILTLILLWTNEFHQLVFQSVSTKQYAGFASLELVPGPWYVVNLAYGYAVILAGLIVLFYGMMRSTPLLRNQYIVLISASLLPWGINMYSEYAMDASHFDLTPITFGLTGILLTYSVIRNRFMDIIPVARSRLIESMSDGVLVLDMQNRIVDINPAMEELLHQSHSCYLGQPAAQILSDWLDKDDLLSNVEQTRSELRIPNDETRYLDMRVTPLYDYQQRLNGRLMIFRDVTDRKQVEKQLRFANDRLQSQLIEIGLLQSRLRSQAIRDPLTELFNRRYLDETLERELERAEYEAYPVCVILLDIDHFKVFNDTYGHEAGDIILRALGTALSSHTRSGDFSCRYGGEEFVIIMPNIDVDTAYQRANDLREVVNSLKIPYGLYNLSITISMGISSYPKHGTNSQSILRAADQAMYAAKNAGRDHILTYNQLGTDHETSEC